MLEQMNQTFAVVVPASGVGKRMQASCPKQYLTIDGQTILSHTLNALLSHPNIDLVVVAISENDDYFDTLEISQHPKIKKVCGGKERADSVLSGLNYLVANHKEQYSWVLVHDAARPCVTHSDIHQLIESCLTTQQGGILATPVRDTMKLALSDKHTYTQIDKTLERSQMWHALTPQMFGLEKLTQALSHALTSDTEVTDEASAMEFVGEPVLLVNGRSDNIKVTQPEDLALASFYLSQNSFS